MLENEVWLHIFNAYLVTSIILWLFDKLSPYSFGNNREKNKNALEKRDFNLKECFWFCEFFCLKSTVLSTCILNRFPLQA